MKYWILALVFLLSGCAGPSGTVWGVVPANSDICPRGHSVSGECY